MPKHTKKSEKSNKILKGIIISLLCIFVMIFIMGTYVYLSFTNNSYVKDKDSIEEMSDYKEVDGISNILLLGSDARSLEEQARADAILILTIDNVHKKLKLSSIMRDTYVEIPGHGEQKINHAHAIGGTELLTETIEENFKIKIDDYAIINFNGFQQLIDAIGGLELNVSSSEMKEMNKFIPEVNPKDPHLVKESGFQLLDGQQALSYARIRKIGNGDYDRTERQREVISTMIDKLKDTSIVKYPFVASKLFPYVKTNIDLGQVLNYAYTVYKINNFTPEQIIVPIPEITESKIMKNKGWVLLTDLDQNAEILSNFIFEDIKYETEDIDSISFHDAIEKYKEEISTNPKDAEEEEPIYNKEEVIKENKENKDNKQNYIENDNIQKDTTDKKKDNDKKDNVPPKKDNEGLPPKENEIPKENGGEDKEPEEKPQSDPGDEKGEQDSNKPIEDDETESKDDSKETGGTEEGEKDNSNSNVGNLDKTMDK